MKHRLLFGLVLILTACGNPEVSIPASTPEAIEIIFPQALQPWVDKLASCAYNVPQIALYFLESEALDTVIQPNSIELKLGQPNNISDVTYLSQVGWEQIVVVVNQENPLLQLSNEELKSIFSGQGLKLEDGTHQPTQVWVLPKEEPTRLIFEHAAMQKQSFATDAKLAPDPFALLETISQNIGAIGYLPGSFINPNDPSISSKVKIIQLESSLKAKLRQPVIAITQSEPKGLMRSLLVCLEANSH